MRPMLDLRSAIRLRLNPQRSEILVISRRALVLKLRFFVPALLAKGHIHRSQGQRPWKCFKRR